MSVQAEQKGEHSRQKSKIGSFVPGGQLLNVDRMHELFYSKYVYPGSHQVHWVAFLQVEHGETQGTQVSLV